jgi:hypothetical protein
MYPEKPKRLIIWNGGSTSFHHLINTKKQNKTNIGIGICI